MLRPLFRNGLWAEDCRSPLQLLQCISPTRRNVEEWCPQSQGILFRSQGQNRNPLKVRHSRCHDTRRHTDYVASNDCYIFLMLEQHAKHFPRIHTAVATVWQGNVVSWKGSWCCSWNSLTHKFLTKPPPLPPRLFSSWNWFAVGLTTILANCKSAVRPTHTYNTLQAPTPSLTQWKRLGFLLELVAWVRVPK